MISVSLSTRGQAVNISIGLETGLRRSPQVACVFERPAKEAAAPSALAHGTLSRLQQSQGSSIMSEQQVRIQQTQLTGSPTAGVD